MAVFASISFTVHFFSCFETSDSKTLPVKCNIQSDFDLLDFDIDLPRGLASLMLTKRNAASGNEILVPILNLGLSFGSPSKNVCIQSVRSLMKYFWRCEVI